jgi:ornithine carbamoyltransferase
MTTMTAQRHLLRISDLDAGELTALLDLAGACKRDPLRFSGALRGRSVACFFSKPSTRTRVSGEAAIWRLGALPIMMRPDELQLGRGEPISDTARVLGSYCAAIFIRTFAQADVEALAAYAGVPVVNALTDDHHPCQALADLLTIREHLGALAGVRVAYVGDGNNVAHSLMEAGALAGMEVVVACPAGYEPDPDIVATTATRVTHDARAAVAGAQVVYTDVWVSMGDDAERDARRAALETFRVDEELMAAASPGALFMHCLPAHRGEEVAAEVIDGPQSVVFDQAANRLPTEQAVLYALTSGDWGAS